MSRRAYRFTDGRPTRQQQVLKLRQDGLDNQTIADRLAVSVDAVKSALQNAARKNPDTRRLAKMREYSRSRRVVRKHNEWCVNHDGRPATHGCRCAECDVVHRRTSSRRSA